MNLENYEGDQKGLGFSQKLNKSNSKELVIPEGLGQNQKHENHNKELVES